MDRRIVAIAFISKQNEPLYFSAPEEDLNEQLHLQLIVHSAIDVLEENIKKRRAQPGNSGSSGAAVQDAFQGLLFSIDDYKIFGSCLHTQTKAVVVCDPSATEVGVRFVFIYKNHLF